MSSTAICEAVDNQNHPSILLNTSFVLTKLAKSTAYTPTDSDATVCNVPHTNFVLYDTAPTYGRVSIIVPGGWGHESPQFTDPKRAARIERLNANNARTTRQFISGTPPRMPQRTACLELQVRSHIVERVTCRILRTADC